MIIVRRLTMSRYIAAAAAAVPSVHPRGGVRRHLAHASCVSVWACPATFCEPALRGLFVFGSAWGTCAGGRRVLISTPAVRLKQRFGGGLRGGRNDA